MSGKVKDPPAGVLSACCSGSANQETPLMSCGDNRETHELPITWARRKILPKGKVAEMSDMKKYAFVLDAEGEQLDPTIEQNAWRLIRQHKAKLVSKFPMVIQLNKVVKIPNHDEMPDSKQSAL